MKQLLRIIVLLCAGAILALPARAVTINITYDVSVTNSGYLTQLQTALGYVTNTYHVLFTNSCTVNLVCYWGSAGPFLGYPVDLSENEAQEAFGFSYAEITNALRNARVSLNDSNAVASLPATDPIATNYWWITRAEAKALNLGTNAANQYFFNNRNDTNNDGVITFASDVTFTFSPTNRAVPGAYDIIGAAEHEISEVMGRAYELNRYDDGRYMPYDLFRFTNSGVRCFDINATNVYFSVNKGTNNLKMFCEDYPETGDDPQDWNPGAIPDAYDAEVGSGTGLPLAAVDLIAMDVLGYHGPSFAASRVTGVLTNHTFRLSFTNATSLPFLVLASTNLTRNITNWSFAGIPVESPTGRYQFTDLLTNKQRFYQMVYP